MTVGGALPTGGDAADIKPTKTTPFIYVVALLSAIGGFLFGYDTGIVSGAMIFVKPEFNLDEFWVELIVSITILLAWVFSIFGGYLADRFGRKPVILAASFIFTAGSIIMGVAKDPNVLCVGRAVVGAAIGLASMAVPMYIAEVAPADKRGALVTINSCFITGGQFIASIVAGGFSYDEKNGWRWMLGLAGVPSLIQFIGFIFMPESPRWLVQSGQDQKALTTLMSIRHQDDSVDEELDSIKADVSESERRKASIMKRSDSVMAGQVWLRVLKNPAVRRALFVGSGLMIFQQCAGINTVMYYSAMIIQMSGVKDKSQAVWLASATAATNFLFTFVGFYLVERIGRRLLTLGSLAGVIASLILLAVGFQLAAVNSPPISDPQGLNVTYDPYCMSYGKCMDCINDPRCGFCFTGENEQMKGTCTNADLEDHSWSLDKKCTDGFQNETVNDYGYDICPMTEKMKPFSNLILVGLILYLVAFAPGMGCMPWTVNSEIYPLWARSFCYSTATSMNWLFNLVISFTFLSLTQAITKHGAFYLYAGIAVLGWIFFFFMQPETKGRNLEDIESLFGMKYRERRKSEAEYRRKSIAEARERRSSSHLSTGSFTGKRVTIAVVNPKATPEDAVQRI